MFSWYCKMINNLQQQNNWIDTYFITKEVNTSFIPFYFSFSKTQDDINYYYFQLYFYLHLILNTLHAYHKWGRLNRRDHIKKLKIISI